MLARAKILSAEDLAAIERGMAAVLDEIRSGRFAWSTAREDVHLNIEHRLTELVGDAGKRLHTGRSRNDQVATDLRLWLRAEIDAIGEVLGRVRSGLLDRPRSTPRPSCPASPTCRWRSRSPSGIT